MSDVDKRIGILETKVDNHERRIGLQEEKNEQLNEIATYVKLQYEHNKTQDEKIEKIGKQFEQVTIVLDGINTNLLSLNHDVKQVKDKQEDMDDRVGELEEERIKELKQFKDETKKWTKETVFKIVTGVLLAALLLWLGLN